MNKKHDHSEVLKTGLRLICDKGYNSLGVNEICKTTGMTKGAFYHTFESKEAFLLKGLRAYGVSNVERLTRQLAIKNGTQNAIDRIAELYDSMFEAQPKNNFMGCMVNNIMSELGSANETVGKAASVEFDSFIHAIEPTVKVAQNEGDLSPTIDSKTITELLHSTFYGLLTRAKSTQDHLEAKRIMRTLINTLRK